MQLQPLENFDVTPYRVSTITATTNINSIVNLQNFFEAFNLDHFDKVKFVEYGKNKTEHCSKGVNQTKKVKSRNPTPKKRFDNQITLHYDLDNQIHNVKLFKNGHLQMTGVKNLENASAVVNDIINIIKFYNKDNELVSDENALRNEGVNVRLINCDFRFSFKINRAALHKLLSEKYGFLCSYEPCIYQGVKLSYFMNDIGNASGICKCSSRCLGKGKNSVCRRITIAAFQSGCLTINGATSIEQVDFLYEKMKMIFKENMSEIHQQMYTITS